MKAWYLIYTKPRMEQVAKEQLERQGYKTYLPLYPARRYKNGRSVKIISPLFNRYLFINLSDKTDDWRPIRSTIGVSNLVRFGQLPARVPDSLIATLVAREDEAGHQIITTITEFKHGQKVRISDGPFAGYEALFEAKSGKDRVVLLLKITEHYVTFKMNKSDIESV